MKFECVVLISLVNYRNTWCVFCRVFRVTRTLFLKREIAVEVEFFEVAHHKQNSIHIHCIGSQSSEYLKTRANKIKTVWLDTGGTEKMVFFVIWLT